MLPRCNPCARDNLDSVLPCASGSSYREQWKIGRREKYFRIADNAHWLCHPVGGDGAHNAHGRDLPWRLCTQLTLNARAEEIRVSIARRQRRAPASPNILATPASCMGASAMTCLGQRTSPLGRCVRLAPSEPYVRTASCPHRPGRSVQRFELHAGDLRHFNNHWDLDFTLD